MTLRLTYLSLSRAHWKASGLQGTTVEARAMIIVALTNDFATTDNDGSMAVA